MQEQKTDDRNPLGALSRDLQEYVQVQTEILRLDLTQKFAGGIASLTLVILLGFIASMLLLLLAVSAGLYFSELFGSYTKGFFLVTGIIFLKLLILFIFRKSLITRPIKNKIIRESFHSNDDSDEQQD
jgi:energy-coupling factor transporter transmembrane protein EcfT